MSNTDTSLEKGLAILEAMNNLGPLRIRDLHERTGYSKPTIVRLLQVMEARGYVIQLERNAGYCLSSRVLALSDGFNTVSRLVEAAGPPLDEFTERALWPAAMAVVDFDHMVVRYSTISKSPLSHTQSTMSRRLSMLHRAHGRAYLAFCPEEERHRLFERLDKAGRDFLEPYLAKYRQQGWAERDPSTEPRTNSIAVPVPSETGCVSATVGVTFFRTSLSEEGKARLAEEVKVAAQGMLERLRSIPPAPSPASKTVRERRKGPGTKDAELDAS